MAQVPQYTLDKPINPVTIMVYDTAASGYKAYSFGSGGSGGNSSTLTAVAQDVTALPSFASGVSTFLESDKSNGALIVAQGNLNQNLDGVSAYQSNVLPVTGDSTMAYFRTGNLTNSFLTVKSSNGNLYSWNIINPNGSVAYVKFYNGPAGNLNTGTSNPIRTLLIPATSQLTHAVNGCSQYYFTGLSVLATSVLADQTNQAANSSALTFECQYK